MRGCPARGCPGNHAVPRLCHAWARTAAARASWRRRACSPVRHGLPSDPRRCSHRAQAALLLPLWDAVTPSAAAARALRPAPPALASVLDPTADLPAQPAAAGTGDADDDGVVLTAEAAQAVESILRRQPRSVLKRLPRT